MLVIEQLNMLCVYIYSTVCLSIYICASWYICIKKLYGILQ